MEFMFIFNRPIDYYNSKGTDEGLSCALTSTSSSSASSSESSSESSNLGTVTFITGTLKLDGSALAKCIIDGSIQITANKFTRTPLEAGVYDLTVLHYEGVEIFRMSVTSLAMTNVHKVHPLVGLSNAPTAITLTTSATIDSSVVTRCCFDLGMSASSTSTKPTATTANDGDPRYVYSPASLLSGFEWTCFTPSMPHPASALTVIPVGLTFGALGDGPSGAGMFFMFYVYRYGCISEI